MGGINQQEWGENDHFTIKNEGMLTDKNEGHAPWEIQKKCELSNNDGDLEKWFLAGGDCMGHDDRNL